MGEEKIHFCGIANIHSMRESIIKFLNVSQKSLQNSEIDTDWLEGAKSSNWLSHINLLLCSSRDIAEIIANPKQHKRRNVLVHCSDGWLLF